MPDLAGRKQTPCLCGELYQAEGTGLLRAGPGAWRSPRLLWPRAGSQGERTARLEVGAQEGRYHRPEPARSGLQGCLPRAVSGGRRRLGRRLPEKWRRMARIETPPPPPGAAGGTELQTVLGGPWPCGCPWIPRCGAAAPAFPGPAPLARCARTGPAAPSASRRGAASPSHTRTRRTLSPTPPARTTRPLLPPSAPLPSSPSPPLPHPLPPPA